MKTNRTFPSVVITLIVSIMIVIVSIVYYIQREKESKVCPNNIKVGSIVTHKFGRKAILHACRKHYALVELDTRSSFNRMKKWDNVSIKEFDIQQF